MTSDVTKTKTPIKNVTARSTTSTTTQKGGLSALLFGIHKFTEVGYSALMEFSSRHFAISAW
jgi:hypothetical protein